MGGKFGILTRFSGVNLRKLQKNTDSTNLRMVLMSLCSFLMLIQCSLTNPIHATFKISDMQASYIHTFFAEFKACDILQKNEKIPEKSEVVNLVL